VNAARPEFAHLPTPSEGVLVAGLYLGTLAIPLYGLGYWQVAEGLAPADPRAARWIFGLGAFGGALGGAVHAMTGLVIHFERLRGAAGADPLAVVATYGVFLVPLWGLIGALTLAGSVLYTRAVLRGGTAYPRWMAATSPVALVVLTSLAGLLTPGLRAFLLPAGPNLSHVLFFALASRHRS
jgi:hypothetical protein